MYQYSDWKCGDCERSFCIAIDDEDSKVGEQAPTCPRCESKSVTPDADAGSSRQETAQEGAANRPGVIALVAAVRILNSPGTPQRSQRGADSRRRGSRRRSSTRSRGSSRIVRPWLPGSES